MYTHKDLDTCFYLCMLYVHKYVYNIDIKNINCFTYMQGETQAQREAYMCKNRTSLLSSLILCPAGLHQEKLRSKMHLAIIKIAH